MKKNNFYLSVLIKVFICWICGTSAYNATEPCQLSIHNYEEVVRNLKKYYQMDGSIIIVEYTLNFQNVSANFSLSRPSKLDAYPPLKLYGSQGVGSYRLLLTYGFLYGIMDWFLQFCTAEQELDLNVNPCDCLDTLTNEKLEYFIIKFMLTELNPLTIRVENLYMCTGSIDVYQSYGYLAYRCYTLNIKGEADCQNVAKDSKVELLHWFIFIVTIFAFFYVHTSIANLYRFELYEFKLPVDKGFIIAQEVTRSTANQSTRDATEGTGRNTDYIIKSNVNSIEGKKIPNEKLEKMKVYKDKLIAKRGKRTYKMQKVLLEIPLYKIFSCGKTEISFFRIVCEMLSSICNFIKSYCVYPCWSYQPLEDGMQSNRGGMQSNRGGMQSNRGGMQSNRGGMHSSRDCGKSCKLVVIILLVIALSLPITVSICFKDAGYREVKKEIIKRGHNAPWDINILDFDNKLGVCIAISVLYLFCLLHMGLSITFERKYRKLFTLISNVNEFCTHFKDVFRNFNCGLRARITWCVLLFIPRIIIENVPLLFSIVALFGLLICQIKDVRDKGKYKLKWILFTLTSLLTIPILMVSVHFLVCLAVILIVIVAMEGAFFYNVIKILILLAVYVRNSFQRVHKPFDTFMTTLLNTELCEELSTVRQSQDPPSTRNDAIRFNTPEFIMNKDIRVKLYHPFIDLCESNISKRFLLDCASIDHRETPGTALDNFVKSVMEFFWVIIFIFFVFLVVMAYGHTYYISPLNHSFTTFLAALFPIIITNFLAREPDRKEGTKESRKQLRKKIKEMLKNFSEEWVVKDFILEEIPSVSQDAASVQQPQDVTQPRPQNNENDDEDNYFWVSVAKQKNRDR